MSSVVLRAIDCGVSNHQSVIAECRAFLIREVRTSSNYITAKRPGQRFSIHKIASKIARARVSFIIFPLRRSTWRILLIQILLRHFDFVPIS